MHIRQVDAFRLFQHLDRICYLVLIDLDYLLEALNGRVCSCSLVQFENTTFKLGPSFWAQLYTIEQDFFV